MEEGFFDRLKKNYFDGSKDKEKVDPVIEKLAKNQHQRALNYFSSLLEQNASKPVVVHSIEAHGSGARKTRESLLDAQLEPILAARNVSQLISAVDEAYRDLTSLGVYDQVQFKLDEHQSIFNDITKLNVKSTVNLKQAKPFVAKTGTNVGDGEGTGYMKFTVKNLLGAAEIVSLDATVGTRTRSSYILDASMPFANSAKWRAELAAYLVTRAAPYASHEQIVRTLVAKLRNSHSEFGYEATWRSINAVKDSLMSGSVRDQAGDGIKTSVYYNYTRDTRDHHLLPTRGNLFKLSQEIAGLLGPQNGDYPFIKSSFEAQVVHSLGQGGPLGTPLPPVILTGTAKGGIIWMGPHQPVSHLMDRFYLGGPNDVRGFLMNGIGPKDGSDSIGGDLFFGSGISAISKLPTLKPENPLRMLSFINGGAVVPVDHSLPISSQIRSVVFNPSVAAGVGLVYTHPAARFELNFTLPLIARTDDFTRKGLQFGIGLSFM
ncbi:sorting assembly machinery 50 kDa subunit [Trichomonascus vanleenenianus]|uniref:outer membrane protein assembly factor n=1 Tax=Trichomonascus vanleenenianus TaxID=2268995 RepID=UPI003ECAFD8D